jgi:AcrR family transcriptional regulator
VTGRERDTARTRRLVLDGAAAAVAAHGAGVSLDQIARRAQVSKGGLLHHFRTRDQLLLELAQDRVDLFCAKVHAAVEPSDHAPGRLVRGYVRAVFDAMQDDATARAYVARTVALAAVPGVAQVLQEDKRRWRAAFAADGLDPQRVLVITRAADGAALAGLCEGGHDQRELARTRDLLLALSRQDAPFVQG